MVVGVTLELQVMLSPEVVCELGWVVPGWVPDVP